MHPDKIVNWMVLLDLNCAQDRLSHPHFLQSTAMGYKIEF
jgi:hypothetical protein